MQHRARFLVAGLAGLVTLATAAVGTTVVGAATGDPRPVVPPVKVFGSPQPDAAAVTAALRAARQYVEDHRVGVTVDGVAVPSSSIASAMMGAWQQRPARGLPRGDVATGETAANGVAATVLDALLVVEGRARGLQPSAEETWERMQAQAARLATAPASADVAAHALAVQGMTLRESLNDRSRIPAYQQLRTSIAMRRVLRGDLKDPAAIQAGLASWLAGAIRTHTVQVSGLPLAAADLPNLLP
jgi:hypothetical protein